MAESKELHDGEIVGLGMPNNGRSCTSHAICGSTLGVGDLVRFRSCIVEIPTAGGAFRAEQVIILHICFINEIQLILLVLQAVSVVKIRDGTEACVVGFLPTNVVVSRGNAMHGEYAQILELYEDNDSKSKREKGYRNHGACSYQLLKTIPQQE
jgi:hypothetical protein